jgi:hypothetical protein
VGGDMSIVSAGTTLTTGLSLASDTNGNLVIKTGASAVTAVTIGASQSLTVAGVAAFQDNVTLPASTTINSVSYTWPAADGSSGDFLTTDGGGTLSWTAAAGLPPVIIANTVSVTAVAGNHYVLTAVSLTTVTLPASPTLSDTVYVTVANSLTTNVVDNNGKPIQGISESLTLNAAYASVQLRFTDDTKGWIFA